MTMAYYDEASTEPNEARTEQWVLPLGRKNLANLTPDHWTFYAHR